MTMMNDEYSSDGRLVWGIYHPVTDVEGLEEELEDYRSDRVEVDDGGFSDYDGMEPDYSGVSGDVFNLLD